MNTSFHIQILKKHIIAIVLITLLAGAGATLYKTIKNPGNFNTTIFLSIGIKQTLASGSYDDVQAADQFTETIQGWMKNPALIERIENQTKNNIGFSRHKQEKQNLVITFTAETNADANKIATILLKELNNEIETYNRAINGQFTIATSGISINEDDNKIYLYGALGIIIGLVLSIGLAYLHESIFRKQK